MPEAAGEPPPRFGVPARLLGTLALGTVLNPLNSSMIAVALVAMQDGFDVGVGTSSWLVSGFYLAAAVGQTLAGRFAEHFGARRMFLTGLVAMCLVCLAAPFAPGFWWLVAIRALQAIATSTAFPAAMIMVRQAAQRQASAASAAEPDSPPAGALATLTVAASTSAAFGPVLGGMLVSTAGWPAVFLVNVPLTLTGLLLGWRLLPRDEPRRNGRPLPRFRDLDIPGVGLFVITLTALLMLLLSAADGPRWWLLPVVVVGATALVWREMAAPTPFLDLRRLGANRPLTTVLLQQLGVNLVFYCVMFGLPMWLERVRGFDTDVVGLLILPATVMSVLITPITARRIRRHGSRPLLLLGLALLILASVAVQLLGDGSPIGVMLGVAVLLGLPTGVTNLVLQTRMYEAAGGAVGTASGLFQTFRYLGAIMSTSVLGIVFERDLTTAGLHHVGLIMVAVAAVLFGRALLAQRNGRRR